MGKCSLLTELTKCTLNIALKLKGVSKVIMLIMKGRARSLKEHYPITAHVPNLDSLTGC